MKLTRTQELSLIDFALNHLLEKLVPKKRGPYKKGFKRTDFDKKTPSGVWTSARRKKFSRTMKKKWADRRKQDVG